MYMKHENKVDLTTTFVSNFTLLIVEGLEGWGAAGTYKECIL